MESNNNLLIKLIKNLSEFLIKNPEQKNIILPIIKILVSKLDNGNEDNKNEDNKTSTKKMNVDFAEKLLDSCILPNKWVKEPKNILLLANCLRNIEPKLKLYLKDKLSLNEEYLDYIWNYKLGNYGLSSLKWIASLCDQVKYTELFNEYYTNKVREDLKNHGQQILNDNNELKIDYLMELSNQMYGDWNKYCNNKLYTVSNNGLWLENEKTQFYWSFRRFLKLCSKEARLPTLIFSQFKSLYSKKYNENAFLNRLDNNSNLLAFENGVYNFTLNKLMSTMPEDYLSMSTKYNFEYYDNLSEEIMRVENLLKEIFSKQEDLNKFVTLVRSIIRGQVTDKRLNTFLGSGANGKTVISNLLIECLGDYAGFMSSDVLTRTDFRLRDGKSKRLFLIHELEHDDVILSGNLKNILSGDFIQYQPLYQNPQTFKPMFQLILNCNSKPKLQYENDDGAKRRINIINFDSVFTENPKKGEYKRKEIDTKRLRSAFMCYILNN